MNSVLLPLRIEVEVVREAVHTAGVAYMRAGHLLTERKLVQVLALFARRAPLWGEETWVVGGCLDTSFVLVRR